MAGAATAARKPLLERERELRRLEDLLAATLGGRGAAVVLEGPAGIGKTSLLRAVQELASERALTALTARGGELERDFAYGVVRQLLEVRLMAAGHAERETLLSGAAAIAAPLVGAVPGAGTQLGADPTAAALHGLYWLIANLAAAAPVALVVDDLHWADAASVRFLAYVARRIGDLPILFVAASRPPVESHAPELIEALGADPAVRRLAPAPLSRAAVGELVARELGGAPAPELVAACHEVTGGNPFLVRSLVDALAELGLEPSADLAGRLPDVGGPAIARSVARRLSGLGPDAEALAGAVAILGTDVEPRHARRLADLGESRASAAADALAAAGVLAAGRALDFVHPLVRAAAVERIAPGERARRHLAAARMLDAEDADAERIAPHVLASDRRGDPWVVDVLRRAAARSVQRGAPDAAVRYLRRALDEPPAPASRGAVLAELGKAEVQAALPQDAVAHLRAAAQATDDPVQRAAMAHDLAIGLIAPGQYGQAVEMLERAVADVADVDRELALGLEAELLTAALMAHETSPLRAARAARADHDLPGDTRGERMLLSSLVWEHVLGGDGAERAVQIARRAVDGGLLRDVTADSGLWINVVYAFIVADEFERADRALEAAFADVRARGSVIGFARNSCFRSFLHHRRGAVAEAESDARRCIEVGIEPGYRIAHMAHAALVDALVEQGELAAADRALRDRRLDSEIPDTFMLNFVLHSRAWLRLAQGRAAAAAGDFEELARREGDWRAPNPGAFPYRSGLALALEDRERALELACEELALARRWGTARAIGISLRTLGVVKGGREGLERLGESVAALERSEARLEHARSLVELGAAIRRAGQRREAREPLELGMDLAHRCGATALTARAREELLAAGARPRRAVRTGVEALTASERRVARMAAEGMTNREIAQALFVTMRTVEVHLTHAYQKLDIGSRDELPAALATG